MSYKRSDLSTLKKDQLQTILIDEFGFDNDAPAVLANRPEIIDTILSLQETEPSLDVITEYDSGDEAVPGPDIRREEKAKMNRFDSGWTDFVIAQLFKNELIDGHPTANGLRRFFEQNCGYIIHSQATVIQAPHKDNKDRATVQYTIHFMRHDSDMVFSITDAADCYYGNTKAPFHKHAVATATTIAEGRCLKKMLNLAIHTGEEKMEPTDSEVKENEIIHDDYYIDDTQKRAIDALCKKYNINQEKFITKNGYNSIDGLSTEEARGLMLLLVKYQRGPDNNGLRIPEDILND